MNILITGVGGFIGSHVAQALLARGDTVAGLDNLNDYYDSARKRANVALLSPHSDFTFYEIDVRNTEEIRHICAKGKFDVIIHLAAMVGERDSIEHGPLYTDVNVSGTVNMLEIAREASTPHFVFASTSSVYGCTGLLPFREDDLLGHPLSPYSATKIAGEVMGHAYHNLFDISFTALRIFSVYGPRGRPDMMPYHIMDCIAHEREFALYEGGNLYRDWVFIDDIVRGVLQAVDLPQEYLVVNLGYGEPVRMIDFVKLVEEMVGKSAWMSTLSAPSSEPPITYADIAKARDILSYVATTPVIEGMSLFWEWYQAEILK
ncbi:MAG: NAD-dependent epimerase/dehydratase family protein [Chloroflexi bacterium]|nr:NAD-dependent epimerase/dehydratase family protein [Chloroflexota bacterium]